MRKGFASACVQLNALLLADVYLKLPRNHGLVGRLFLAAGVVFYCAPLATSAAPDWLRTLPIEVQIEAPVGNFNRSASILLAGTHLKRARDDVVDRVQARNDELAGGIGTGVVMITRGVWLLIITVPVSRILAPSENSRVLIERERAGLSTIRHEERNAPNFVDRKAAKAKAERVAAFGLLPVAINWGARTNRTAFGYPGALLDQPARRLLAFLGRAGQSFKRGFFFFATANG